MLVLHEVIAGNFAPKTDCGGRPSWVAIEYQASSPADCRSVDVVLAPTQDDATQRWYPHVRAGLIDAARNSEGVAFRVEIIKVAEHPVDTTAQSCARIGAALFRMLSSYCA